MAVYWNTGDSICAISDSINKAIAVKQREREGKEKEKTPFCLSGHNHSDTYVLRLNSYHAVFS